MVLEHRFIVSPCTVLGRLMPAATATEELTSSGMKWSQCRKGTENLGSIVRQTVQVFVKFLFIQLSTSKSLGPFHKAPCESKHCALPFEHRDGNSRIVLDVPHISRLLGLAKEKQFSLVVFETKDTSHLVGQRGRDEAVY